MSNYNNTLFVTENYIKNNTPIQHNVEYKNLRPTIRFVQDSRLQALLGTPLYRELQKQVAEQEVTPIKPDYKILLDDYIVHILVHGFMSEAPVDMLIKYMNVTVGTTNSENIQSASLTQVKYLQEQHKGRAEFYMERLADWLCYNTEKYPEFFTAQEEEMHPRDTTYTSNIYTGKPFGGKISKEVFYDGAVYDIKNRRWNFE